jgi:hydroxymethylglutaryl-CoA lyase
VAALVPNLKGAERALQLGVHKINYVISASESHNQANVRRSTEESAVDFERIVALCRDAPPRSRPIVVGGLSTAMGCTIEGRVAEERVRALALRLVAAGADEIILADTVGYGDPAAVRRLFGAVKDDVGDVPITAHFHDTRGLGLANVVAALDAGIRAFDASLAGLGGCPYAPGASGNICTEDLVFLLESMGLKTGIDLERLIAVRALLCARLGDQAYHGTIAQAGLPRGFRSAAQA